MRKTYKSSNVRFCMEDENQRRTWEYLQSLTRKDSSYGKALSDAFVLVLDGKVSKGEAEELCFSTSVAEKAISEGNIPCGKMLSEDAFREGLKVTAEHIEDSVAERISKMQEAFLRQLTKELEEHVLRIVSGEDTPHREQYEEETEQVSETDMSDAMMSMALAMGE
ncbi:MAG: hypothetical protein ACI4HI_00490 [Lachnospiraceae bacterium]